ncbi:hypothetical protein L7F22_057383 [Adiantum nelumboides]|nr:hypothetical protein [Adiantum nelumboides]
MHTDNTSSSHTLQCTEELGVRMETALEPAEIKQQEQAGNYHERSYFKGEHCTVACSSPTSHAELGWIGWISTSSSAATASDGSESDFDQYDDTQSCTGVVRRWVSGPFMQAGYTTPPPLTKRKRVACPPPAPRKRKSVAHLPPIAGHLNFFSPLEIEVFFAAHSSGC